MIHSATLEMVSCDLCQNFHVAIPFLKKAQAHPKIGLRRCKYNELREIPVLLT